MKRKKRKRLLLKAEHLKSIKKIAVQGSDFEINAANKPKPKKPSLKRKSPYGILVRPGPLNVYGVLAQSVKNSSTDLTMINQKEGEIIVPTFDYKIRKHMRLRSATNKEKKLISNFLNQSLDDKKEIYNIPVRLFISNSNLEDISDVEIPLRELLANIGFKIFYWRRPQIGSWFRRMVAKSRDIIARREVKERLEKIERAIEVQTLIKPQAEADSKILTAVSDFIRSVGDNEAAAQIGSILVVKKKNSTGGFDSIARTLSQKQLLFLENNPQFYSQPSSLLSIFSTIENLEGLEVDTKQIKSSQEMQLTLQQ
jgi:hypothetical protein